MKQILSIALFLSTALSISAQDVNEEILDWDKDTRAKIEQSNDSIVNEGYKLYYYEKAAWIGTDMAMEHCKDNEEVGGVFTYEAADGKIHCIATDKFFLWCFFDYTLDDKNTYSDSKRSLTANEMQMLKRYQTITEKCLETGILEDHGTMNRELIPLPNNRYRMYWLTSTTKNNVVPLGNDYSFDFDKDLNLIKQTKYHKSFIPIEVGNNAEIIAHSHLEDNPYMTPTDVCNFLLYARDCFNINFSYVYSKINNIKCVHIINGKDKNIATLTMDALKKILNHHSKENKE